ncbi:hypothetical protein [Microcoleus sp. herbarium12]|jgi:hypothetical protein
MFLFEMAFVVSEALEEERPTFIKNLGYITLDPRLRFIYFPTLKQ